VIKQILKWLHKTCNLFIVKIRNQSIMEVKMDGGALFLIFLIWFVLSIVIGFLASAHGRSPVLWIILAFVISPLLAGIILYLIPDLFKEEEKEIKQQEIIQKETEKQDKKVYEENKIASSEVIIAMEKLTLLNNKKIISDIEFNGRKLKLIHDIKKRNISGRPEEFLGDLILLLEKNILAAEEMAQIKQIVFSFE